MKKSKVGLALGGGGARGLAHIGVIKELVANEIPIDVITGTSMGAMVGGLYAALGNIKGVEEIANGFNYWDRLQLFADPIWGEGLIKGKKIEDRVRKMVGDVDIEDLRIPFGAVATDLNTAEVVVIDKGDLAKGVRASASVPFLFQPIKMANRYLVDGGLSCPVPVEIARQMGAEIVIAVNLDSAYFLPENRKDEKMTNLSVLKNSIYLLRYHLAQKEVREADVVINPVIPYVSEFEFTKGSEIIKGGELTTKKAIALIKKALA